MNLNDVIFVDSLPKIDLHGMTRDIARFYIKGFLQDQIKLKNEIVCIVHGIGSGALRSETKEVLEKSRFVVEFKTYYYNQGLTIVKLKIGDEKYVKQSSRTTKETIRKKARN